MNFHPEAGGNTVLDHREMLSRGNLTMTEELG